tara:strand:- start:426 stop:611 length:186 start_codon:yes stop_codon:yes gene_type:complete
MLATSVVSLLAFQLRPVARSPLCRAATTVAARNIIMRKPGVTPPDELASFVAAAGKDERAR